MTTRIINKTSAAKKLMGIEPSKEAPIQEVVGAAFDEGAGSDGGTEGSSNLKLIAHASEVPIATISTLRRGGGGGGGSAGNGVSCRTTEWATFEITVGRITTAASFPVDFLISGRSRWGSKHGSSSARLLLAE